MLSEHAINAFGSWDSYRDRYLVKLLAVFERALRTGELEYFHILCAERIRFLDDTRLAKGGWRELETILDGDRACLLGHVGEYPHLADELARILDALDAMILRRGRGRLFRLALVGDCLMVEIRAFLRPEIAAADMTLDTNHLYFSARMGYDLSVRELESTVSEQYDLIALSFFTFEGIPPYTALLREAGKLSEAELKARCDALLNLVHDLLTQVRSTTQATVLLHGCSGLPLKRRRHYVPFIPALERGQARVAAQLNAGLAAIAGATDNVVFLDERAVVAAAGERRANSRLLPRFLTHGGTFHYSRLGAILAAEYGEVIGAYVQLSPVKVLLVDFDNTLWSGVMAEGEVVHDREAQSLLKELQQSGILLVAVSKNDPNSIRWDEMILSKDDFVGLKINWNPKPQSVDEIAKELDLDPASFVLIDDSPVERHLMSSHLPAVTVMDSSERRTWDRLRMMLSFPNTRRTAEAERRTAMYREAAERRSSVEGTVDYPTMMRSLQLRSQWRTATAADLDRVHELMTRTNQFNTTNLQLARHQLAALLKDPNVTIHLATLGDKFGQLGIVGVVITHAGEGQLVFDSVIMSCRAMGFGLERLLIRGPIDAACEARTAIGRFVPTARNSPCASLFKDSGFEPGDGDEWTLDLGDSLPDIPEWLAVDRC